MLGKGGPWRGRKDVEALVLPWVMPGAPRALGPSPSGDSDWGWGRGVMWGTDGMSGAAPPQSPTGGGLPLSKQHCGGLPVLRGAGRSTELGRRPCPSLGENGGKVGLGTCLGSGGIQEGGPQR